MNICKTEAFVKIEMLRYDNSIVKLGVLEEVGEGYEEGTGVRRERRYAKAREGCVGERGEEDDVKRELWKRR